MCFYFLDTCGYVYIKNKVAARVYPGSHFGVSSLYLGHVVVHSLHVVVFLEALYKAKHLFLLLLG